MDRPPRPDPRETRLVHDLRPHLLAMAARRTRSWELRKDLVAEGLAEVARLIGVHTSLALAASVGFFLPDCRLTVNRAYQREYRRWVRQNDLRRTTQRFADFLAMPLPLASHDWHKED
jgi:hypothetical protein